MNVIRLMLAELIGMFVDDEFLALAIIAVVAVAAVTAASPAICGTILLVGCLTVLVASVLRTRRKHR